jgi:cell division cycle protein 37
VASGTRFAAPQVGHLNYSKWDQLEVCLSLLPLQLFSLLHVSDDSDIKGHPNVDKGYLIRSVSLPFLFGEIDFPSHRTARGWKQSDIHEKREVRNHSIEQLGAEVACNDVVLARLSRFPTLSSLTDSRVRLISCLR